MSLKEGKKYKNKIAFTCFYFALVGKAACSDLT